MIAIIDRESVLTETVSVQRLRRVSKHWKFDLVVTVQKEEETLPSSVSAPTPSGGKHETSDLLRMANACGYQLGSYQAVVYGSGGVKPFRFYDFMPTVRDMLLRCAPKLKLGAYAGMVDLRQGNQDLIVIPFYRIGGAGELRFQALERAIVAVVGNTPTQWVEAACTAASEHVGAELTLILRSNDVGDCWVTYLAN